MKIISKNMKQIQLELVLDLGYPSNHYTFGPVVEETPIIIFRKPEFIILQHKFCLFLS